jgi:ADP-ribose pyrophosphatase YjhB (NUDIX family)
MIELPIEFAYEFCPRCSRKANQLGEVPFRCVQCGFANFFGPVAAVGAMVTNELGKLLLVRRAKNPGEGCWGLPGGFVDRFETAEDAVAREVLEETDLRVVRTEFLMTHHNKYNYSGIVAPVIDLFFCCDVAPGEISLVDGELDLFEWVHPTDDHLANMAFPSNRIAIERWMQKN